MGVSLVARFKNWRSRRRVLVTRKEVTDHIEWLEKKRAESAQWVAYVDAGLPKWQALLAKADAKLIEMEGWT